MSTIAIWGIITAVALLAPILGVWPIRFWGKSNQNSVWFIRMRRPEEQVQPHAAIFAQEVVEFWLRWLFSCTAAFPAAWLLQGHELGQYFTVLAILSAHILNLVWLRQLELIGHAVELVYARKYHGTGPDYDRAEAETMARGYDCFKDDTVDDLLAAMKRREWISIVLIRILFLRIKREA